ncbi:hypothetical protein J4E08_06230 [Sagittula sp. NFXS13]|uniref:hypothetical protein n=1 Tax=Sagittula sp. NFXS13 TaxID=2819095 RepID=UPI0032E04CB0
MERHSDVWLHSPYKVGLPIPLDCETRAMLRLFLAPILQKSESWQDVAARLEERGYELGFCEGRMVVYNDIGQALCTGSDIGIPMSELSRRLGRPCIIAHPDGETGALRRAKA